MDGKEEFYTLLIEKLQDDLGAYKKNGIEMGKLITSLKRQIGGYKGRCKQMSDELAIKRKRLEEKEKAIIGLTSQVSELKSRYKDLLMEKEQEMKALKNALERERMPWWKKLFE